MGERMTPPPPDLSAMIGTLRGRAERFGDRILGKAADALTASVSRERQLQERVEAAERSANRVVGQLAADAAAAGRRIGMLEDSLRHIDGILRTIAVYSKSGSLLEGATMDARGLVSAALLPASAETKGAR